ncbi:hypothetical protein JH146_0580 [Methanocaldococcus bathoardescens]|uniref:DUF5518 domain-containing protein n=1 Tax=Methanocaldococcus bathoardescens TaxID=1301915 RepID=A0A076LIT8_9EURY|nr:hypothetical protein [Methanocaldococcus bathoardescens]AIJ05429.1 hypothetical protein JH146_0580 [Methanocaldococcus bathoardescens]
MKFKSDIMLKPIIIGGVIGGILGSICNCCCIMNLVAGAITAHFIKESGAMLDTESYALAGGISGAIAGVISGILGTIFAMFINIPFASSSEEMMASMGLTMISGVLSIIFGIIFGAIMGAVGAILYLKVKE